MIQAKNVLWGRVIGVVMAILLIILGIYMYVNIILSAINHEQFTIYKNECRNEISDDIRERVYVARIGCEIGCEDLFNQSMYYCMEQCESLFTKRFNKTIEICTHTAVNAIILFSNNGDDYNKCARECTANNCKKEEFALCAEKYVKVINKEDLTREWLNDNTEGLECNYYNIGCPVFGIRAKVKVDIENWHGGMCNTKYKECTKWKADDYIIEVKE